MLASLQTGWVTGGRPIGSTRARPSAPFIAPAPSAPRAPFSRRRSIQVAAATTLQDAPLVPVGQAEVPEEPGVYAIFAPDGSLQYIGLTRKLSASIAGHARDVPELAASVKLSVLRGGTREDLTATWKAWVEEAIAATDELPPGNLPGDTRWTAKGGARAKPEIRLTAGKAINGTIIELIDQVVKDKAVVAFIKGTRTQPQCGFSARVVAILGDMGADYEVVNVLDDVYNPGLREAIKEYSQWPTIPQLYVKGEFIGGADIVEQMTQSGELHELLGKSS